MLKGYEADEILYIHDTTPGNWYACGMLIILLVILIGYKLTMLWVNDHRKQKLLALQEKLTGNGMSSHVTDDSAWEEKFREERRNRRNARPVKRTKILSEEDQIMEHIRSEMEADETGDLFDR